MLLQSPRLVDLHSARLFFQDWVAFSNPKSEHLWVALTRENGICACFSEFPGNESGAPFLVRQILSDALECQAAGIFLAHNHPSGDPRPSGSDCRATQRLATAAEALGCRVLDHLIFAGPECTSFRNLGLL